MSDRVVTVFGGSGFLGRHLIRRLAKSGARIRVAVRNVDSALFLKPMGDVGQIVPVSASVTDEASVRRVIAGSDAVINLVGILFEKGGQRFDDIHVAGAERVARIAREEGVSRLVHVSAIGADPNSDSNYARTKGLGEQAVREAFPDAVILRPSVIFGPEDDFFNRFAAMTRFSPALPLLGGGKTRFQPVFVGDVADAIMAGLERDDATGKLFELGGPTVYSFRELMEYMLKVLRRHRGLIPVPFPVAGFIALFAGLMPKPMITRDQLRLLRRDNVVSATCRDWLTWALIRRRSRWWRLPILRLSASGSARASRAVERQDAPR